MCTTPGGRQTVWESLKTPCFEGGWKTRWDKKGEGDEIHSMEILGCFFFLLRSCSFLKMNDLGEVGLYIISVPDPPIISRIIIQIIQIENGRGKRFAHLLHPEFSAGIRDVERKRSRSLWKLKVKFLPQKKRAINPPTDQWRNLHPRNLT